MKVFRPMLAAHGLTEQQWRVLRALRAADEPVDATGLAASTFLLAPSLSRILAHLDDEGLIDRIADPADNRRSLVSLSLVGAERVDRVGPASEAGYAALESAFGVDRLTRLLGELSDLAALEIEVGATGPTDAEMTDAEMTDADH